ncbi:MAG1890 family putative lipoprotein [Mycoplasmopsis agalactiae]|uniref:MAG1890 family putative lipoprotein n=1 Tax=Mycoplasmopsis agalactiae TaxID=2110 RepID=UPI0032EB778D
MLLDIENKSSLLSSDVTIHNIEKHAKVSKPEHIKLEFVSVTQRNNSLEVEYRIINKDKSKSLPNKVVVTGFKDSLINENIIINPGLIPPINHEKPIMKDAETNTDDNSNSSSTSRTDSGTQSDSPASSEPEKANSEHSIERKIKEKGCKLNELTAYPYDLIDVDEDTNKTELAKKLDDAITHKSGAIALVGGSFFSKHNNSPLTGLSINKSIKPETKNQISTHNQSSPIGFFSGSGEFGIKVERHGEINSKKYLFKWRLVKEDGHFGSKVYEQIIDLSD